MDVTTDRDDDRLTHGIDETPVPMAAAYLVLPDSELDKGFTRPLRATYIHQVCEGRTTMGDRLAQTYARDPKFYGATYCVRCRKHRPVEEFHWEDGQVVGS